MAGGVIAALAAQGLERLPVSGQDGDHAALNRVALGLQAVSVWKDARALGTRAAEIALWLAAGRPAGEIPDSVRWNGGPRGESVDALLLRPIPITRESLDRVIEAGWAPRERVCRNTQASPPPACR
jgi:D-xylose transport system substrate-binding protein